MGLLNRILRRKTAVDQKFVEELAASRIWIFAFGLRGTPNLTGLAGDERRRALAEHVIDVAEVKDEDSVSPYNYKLNGKSTLPFFRSRELAEKFFEQLKTRASSKVFQPYSLMAGFLAVPENEIFELIMNPDSSDERTLSRAERELLRSPTSK